MTLQDPGGGDPHALTLKVNSQMEGPADGEFVQEIGGERLN